MTTIITQTANDTQITPGVAVRVVAPNTTSPIVTTIPDLTSIDWFQVFVRDSANAVKNHVGMTVTTSGNTISIANGGSFTLATGDQIHILASGNTSLT